MKQTLIPVQQYFGLTLALIAASVGCLLMIVVRVLLTGSIRYSFLLWNLFLAWIPYVLALVIGWIGAAARGGVRVKALTAVIGLLWLFFYPNAPYILTDFIHVIQMPIHVTPRHAVLTETSLLWYDIILNSSFSFIGHIIGLISLLILHRTIRGLYRESLARAVVGAAILLGGYGIYLGRFERFNSWDILSDPLTTLEVALVNLVNPKAVLFSLGFAFFIFLTYLIVYCLHETAVNVPRSGPDR